MDGTPLCVENCAALYGATKPDFNSTSGSCYAAAVTPTASVGASVTPTASLGASLTPNVGQVCAHGSIVCAGICTCECDAGWSTSVPLGGSPFTVPLCNATIATEAALADGGGACGSTLRCFFVNQLPDALAVLALLLVIVLLLCCCAQRCFCPRARVCSPACRCVATCALRLCCCSDLCDGTARKESAHVSHEPRSRDVAIRDHGGVINSVHRVHHHHYRPNERSDCGVVTNPMRQHWARYSRSTEGRHGRVRSRSPIEPRSSGARSNSPRHGEHRSDPTRHQMSLLADSLPPHVALLVVRA